MELGMLDDGSGALRGVRKEVSQNKNKNNKRII